MNAIRCLLSFALLIFAAIPVRAQSLRDEAMATATRALAAMQSYQKNGGWVSAYSLGQGIFWGENLPVTDDFITVQYPATPATAGIFLRSGIVLKEERWIEVARQAHAALRQLQSPEGGFPHEGPPAKGHAGHGSFDDGVTTGALNFFIDWWRYTGAAEDRAAVDQAGGFLLTAQYANSGGWPQSYPPPQKSYGKCITFNDGNFRNIITALFRLHKETGDVRYREAALRGGECILRLQGGEGESIWAQQYDPDTLEPAWARKFEPPGYSASESAGVCMTLLDLLSETGDPRYLDSLRRALAWYDTHKLENGLYARLYEPGTQRPVYGRREVAEKFYDVAQACEGYAWQGTWYPKAASEAVTRIDAQGIEAWREERQKVTVNVAVASEGEVRGACDSLGPTGFWTTPPSPKETEEIKSRSIPTNTPMVHLDEFNSKMTALLNYLESNGQ